MRLTRARIIVAILIIAVVAVIGIFVNATLLTPATIDHPSPPPSLAALRSNWGFDILLPTYMPKCLAFQKDGASIDQDSTTSNGQILDVRIVPITSPACASASGTSMVIGESPDIMSLTGDVTTITYGRMQFARVIRSTQGGGTETVLQWHCASVMCRITATTNNTITENVLARMADSFQMIGPSG